VSNAAPAATAGPDTTADWGRDVSFTGQAVDPGSNDQSTLSYVWDFGDGTPPASASAGQSVTHQYATPDTYTATLTVTDKNGGQDTDSRDVVVTKRAVTASYLGATAATYDTAATLRASLVDEYGQNVSGRSVDFEVDDVAKGSSNTGSNGVASVAYTPTEDAGGYVTEAAFAGDSKYEAASSAGNVVVAAKATTLTYTGALSGGAKKTVTLSAKLLDATGKPLGGRTVSFQLGTQSTSATTDAVTGIATAPLKLTQKNGSYALTSTYAPTGGDVGKYLGSSSSNTFKLQIK
jgi:PKD repeat protein